MRPFIFQEHTDGTRVVALGTRTHDEHRLAQRFITHLALAAMRAGAKTLHTLNASPIEGVEEGFVELTARYPR